MRERELIKASFFISTIGLIILYISNPQPAFVKISEIENKLDQRVVISGEIESLKIHENGHIFLEVKDETGEIKVVIFKNVVKKLKKELTCLEVNRNVSIEGKVTKYRGEIEVVAEEVRCKS